MLEVTGELFKDRVKRHESVSVEDAYGVYRFLCSGLFMALV